MHFLGGSFTYRPNTLMKDSNLIRNIIVEIRLHISDHYFICSMEQINDHEIVYLIGETVRWDSGRKQYLWMETEEVKKNANFYRISCISEKKNRACVNFSEDMWAFCESANRKMGYSILIRRFAMAVERFSSLQLAYSACCWANATNSKIFRFSLTVETHLKRINHSPYPYIPASYYVDYNNPQNIQVFASDLDGDEIICEHYNDTLGGFLTIRATSNCDLIYQRDRLGKQFGQFWIMDRSQNQILTRSLISVQIQVLKNIVCNEEPELLIRHGQENTDETTTKINQDVYLTVSLQPNCLLIQPQEQTITELTTLCSNSPPVILADGGIEVEYQCQPLLCEKHYVCFIGEFSLKLPSTETKCFVIQVEGSVSECDEAAREYNKMLPRNRHFDSAEPMTQSPVIGIPTKYASAKIVIKSSRSTSRATTIMSNEESQRKSPVFIILASLLLLGLAGFFGWKMGWIKWIQQFIDQNRSLLSKGSKNRQTLERRTLSTSFDETISDTQSLQSPLNESDSPRRIKVRSQHVQLGPLDEDEI